MADSELNYAPVGIARPGAAVPRGLREREQRIRLGSGEALWARGVDAVSGWAIKKGVRFQVAPDDDRVVLGRDYDTRFGVGVLRLLEPVRVVWVEDAADRRGFGYGTRAGHPITGEECFLVERDADGVVWLVVRTVSRISRGRWLVLWPGIRLMQPVFQRRYARSALRLIAGNPLPGLGGLRRSLVGDDTPASRAARRNPGQLGYGMNPERGPFDEPPAEPIELDAEALPWELREPDPEAPPSPTGT